MEIIRLHHDVEGFDDWLGNRVRLGSRVLYPAQSGRSSFMVVGEVIGITVAQDYDGDTAYQHSSCWNMDTGYHYVDRHHKHEDPAVPRHRHPEHPGWLPAAAFSGQHHHHDVHCVPAFTVRIRVIRRNSSWSGTDGGEVTIRRVDNITLLSPYSDRRVTERDGSVHAV